MSGQFKIVVSCNAVHEDFVINDLFVSLAIQWLLMSEPTQAEYSVPLVEDLLIDEHFLTADKISWLRSSMLVQKDVILSTANATIGQRDNSMWAAIRKLRFTASKFGDLLKAVAKQRYISYSFLLLHQQSLLNLFFSNEMM